YLSSTQKTVKLNLQSSTVSLLFFYKKTLIQSLTNTVIYLYYTKQLKEREILYIYSIIYIHCFYY
ncbi:hypothetical protein EMPG_11689, partial [Blastomyces silverae]